MNAAIQQRVEQFVREIMALVNQVVAERRAAMLGDLGAILAGAARRSRVRTSSPRSAKTATTGEAMQKAAASPRGRQGRRPAARATATASSSKAAVDAPAEATETAAPISTTTPASGSAGPISDREARVLEAVRVLGRATAGEVAARTGLPNGTVAVTLRALVGRGLVERVDTQRGAEYGAASAAVAVA